MKRDEILKRLKQLHGAYYFLSESEKILVGMGDDYIQVNGETFALLTEGMSVETKWNDGYLHLGAIVDKLHIITLLSPRDNVA